MESLNSKEAMCEIVCKFKENVKKYPKHIAIKDSTKSYTYEMLDLISDRMAKNIVRYFNGEVGKKILILHDANNELIITILAVLKSGNTYIPVEKATPFDRIKYILDDSNSDLCLCDTAGLSMKKNFSGNYTVKSVDEFINSSELEKNYLWISGTEVAYVIYTSGTTGVPKGVAVTHKNVVSLIDNTRKLFNFSHSDNWLLFHSCAFDFSVWEIFGSLLTGGTLYIPKRETIKNLELVASIILKEKITVLNQTPSSFYVLQEFLGNTDSISVRVVIFGGEKLIFSRIKTWYEKNSSCKFINMYGITEATVHTTFHHIKDSDFEKTESIIGTPIPGWKISLRDLRGNLISNHEKGEIWIGGEGVTKGYINNLELTSEKYIECDGTVWFKTGDLAYENEDRDLCYVGRIDKQVKIRGHRIELSEIDETLYILGRIRSHTTVVEENEECKLITFVKFSDIDETSIRGMIGNHLPKYMMPTYIVFVNDFPRNMNGKVDYEHLLENFNEYSKSFDVSGDSKNYYDTNSYIQEIFRKHLKKNIEYRDNFFEVGVDSMMAMRITMEINKRFPRVHLSVIDFYKNSTIEKLERVVGKRNGI